MKKHHEFYKAIQWIRAGNPTVIIKEQYIDKIEKLLNIKLKRLSHLKYLVMNRK